jgi:glycosyl transferase family 2
MSRPLVVSIVITNYNYGRFVADAIDSALRQTYPLTEVVVVDDGSTDDSRRIIESRRSEIRTIFKTNGGQASALNAGFGISTGELILFLDSDDMLSTTAVETVVREWREGTILIEFPLEVVSASGEPLGQTIVPSVVPSILVGPFWGGSPTSGNMFSRTVLEKIMPISEEWANACEGYLTLASGLFGDVRHLEQPLGKYRVHEDNSSWARPPVAMKEQPPGKRRVREDRPCAERKLASLGYIRCLVHHVLLLHHELSRLAGGRIGPLENWLGTCPQHWIARIASLRESPHDHPWPDSRLGLMGRAMKATWRQPYWNFRRKLAYTAFAVAYSILPWKAACALKNMEGRARRGAFRRLLGTPDRRPLPR